MSVEWGHVDPFFKRRKEMTAIGFVLILLGLAGDRADKLFEIPEWVVVAAVLLFATGIGLFIAGVTTWLWRVMP